MGEALADAEQFLHGSTSNGLQEALRGRSFTLPSDESLRAARLKLDMLTFIWERRLQPVNVYLRYLFVDSSPQFGSNYLCMREDRISIPRGQYNCVFSHSTDLTNHFETRVCVASVTGHRNAGAMKKASNVGNVLLMESDDAPMFDEKRGEFRGGCADQGTEKSIGDESVRVAHGFGDYPSLDPDWLFLFPWLLMSLVCFTCCTTH